jgi:hypothetical protein
LDRPSGAEPAGSRRQEGCVAGIHPPKKLGKIFTPRRAYDKASPNLDAIVEYGIPAIVEHHRPRSTAKAERIVAEYDRIIELLSLSPYVLAARSHGGRVYPFQAGTWLLYYRELAGRRAFSPWSSRR